MTEAEIYRYSNRADVDAMIEAMRERIVAELRADRGHGLGLSTQDYMGREEYRSRMSRMQALTEAREVTYAFSRSEYMRIENEVSARWGIHA
jgi:hypothetical protein